MGKKKGKTSLDSFMGSPKTKDKKAQDSPRSKKAKSSKKGNKTKERKSAKPKASMVAFRRATRDYEKTDPSIKPSAKKAENTEQIKVDGERISIETGATAKKKEEQHKADTTPLKKNYFPKNTEPIGDMAIPFDMPRERRESQQSWHLRQLFKKGDVITDMERGVLLTVEYSGKMNKAYAKFYDLADHKIKIWIDTTNHEPYCLHREKMEVLEEHEDLQSYNGLKRMETVKRYDLLQDKEIKVTKIYGETPTDIGGARGIKATLDGAWEANIRYHHNFIYDRGLVPGLFYTIKNGKLTQIKPEIDDQLQSELEKIFQGAKPEMKEMAKVYQPIFYTPVPKMKRVAFDIEVEDTDDGMVPNPRSAKYEIISVAFVDNEEKKFVYILDRKNVEEGNYPEDFPKDAEVFFFKDEKTLLEETFRVIWDYPIVITFNGDNFDNMYLYHRAKRLKIDEKINPIYTARGGGMVSNYTYYKHSVHIDIFQFYANRSIKGYAFGSAYLQNSLEEISTGLLGEGKIKHEDTSIGAMTLADLVYYNLTDSIRTMELTTFNDELMFHLLVILARITKLPLQDVFRYQISTWIKSLMIFEHRRKNFLIPRRRELNEKDQQSTVGPVIEGKGFKGAYVITPKPGIHFEVAVLDFSSLYPSIIKTKNLSYETVNCVHEECQENMLPNTPFWSCTKKMGVFAYVVGYFRDVRVNWFKPRIKAKELSKEERKRANVMASALKVFINGAYGVFGSPVFQFYCLRVAESTTAIGRFSIKQTIEKSESMGIEVLYGDSDSVFLLNPTEQEVQQLVEWSMEKLDLDLELEKIYQFLALSERKKNYIGVYKGGEYVDIKGLLAKKHNTPDFIKKKFAEFQDVLKNVTNMDTFKQKREEIIKVVRETINLIGKPPEKGGFEIKDYAITMAIKKSLDKYQKTTPQHVKAALMLPKKEQDKIEKGSFIRYVKTRNKSKVKPLKYASIKDLNYEKYKKMVKSTFEQVLDALQIHYSEVKGTKKLSSFF